MRNSDSPTKRSVETFKFRRCWLCDAILAICYRYSRKRLRSNFSSCKFYLV